MNYCKNYTTIGGRFSDDTVITNITIPAGCGRILQFVVRSVLRNEGKIWENPALGVKDKSILLTTITFPNNEARRKCCEEIEEVIEQTVLMKHRNITVPLAEYGENRFDVNLNLHFLFCEFQSIMKKIRPAIEFIENNGGWFDEKNNQFTGLDELVKARAYGTLDETQKTALFEFSKFMSSYLLGNHIFDDTEIPTEEK